MTTPAPADVTTAMYGNVSPAIGQDAPVHCTWTYRPAAPLSVDVEFAMANSVSLTWTLSRDLLTTGLGSTFGCGEGDVRVHRNGENLVISLCSPSGYADVVVPARDVDTFLQRTFTMVARGEEEPWLNLDGVIHALLTTV